MDSKGYTYYFVTNVIERPDGYTFSGLQTATEELNRLLKDNENAIKRLRRAKENYDALAKEIYPSGELTPSDMVLALRSIILERSQYINMYIKASSQAHTDQTQEIEALKRKLEQSQRLVDNLGDSLDAAQSEQTRLYEELEYKTGQLNSEIELLKKELDHTKAENSRLKQLLCRMEWIQRVSYRNIQDISKYEECPFCLRVKPQPHTEFCELKKAIDG